MPEAGAQRELAVDGSNSKIEPAVGPESSTARVDDRRQHLVEVEARADRLADLAERRSSSTERSSRCAARARWKSSTFRIAIAPCAAKRRDELDRPLAERVDLRAPQRDHTDDAAVHEHRDAEHGPEAAELAGLLPLVARVGGASAIWRVRRSSPTRPTSVPGPCGIGCSLRVAPVRGGATDARRRAGRRRRRAGRPCPRRRSTAGRRGAGPSRTPAPTCRPSGRSPAAPHWSPTRGRPPLRDPATASRSSSRAHSGPTWKPPQGPRAPDLVAERRAEHTGGPTPSIGVVRHTAGRVAEGNTSRVGRCSGASLTTQAEALRTASPPESRLGPVSRTRLASRGRPCETERHRAVSETRGRKTGADQSDGRSGAWIPALGVYEAAAVPVQAKAKGRQRRVRLGRETRRPTRQRQPPTRAGVRWPHDHAAGWSPPSSA